MAIAGYLAAFKKRCPGLATDNLVEDEADELGRQALKQHTVTPPARHSCPA